MGFESRVISELSAPPNPSAAELYCLYRLAGLEHGEILKMKFICTDLNKHVSLVMFLMIPKKSKVVEQNLFLFSFDQQLEKNSVSLFLEQ